MKQVTTHIGPSGRIVVPAEFRNALGMGIGDEVILRLDEGAIAVFPRALSVRRAQRLVREYVAHGRQLSTELMVARRAEAAEVKE